jgi:hypothetical protein
MLIIKGGFNDKKYVQLAQQTYDKLASNLEQFHLKADGLLPQMKAADAYISGSFPLSITHPNVKPNDLDLYVGAEGTASLVDYLVQEGYGTPVELGKKADKGRASYKEDEGDERAVDK